MIRRAIDWFIDLMADVVVLVFIFLSGVALATFQSVSWQQALFVWAVTAGLIVGRAGRRR